MAAPKRKKDATELTDAQLAAAIEQARAGRDELKRVLLTLVAERDRRTVAARSGIAAHQIETAGVRTSTGVH